MTAAVFGDWATAVGAGATLGLLAAAIWAGSTAKASVTTAATGISSQIDHQRTIELRRRVFEHLSMCYSRDFVEASADLQILVQAFDSDRSDGEKKWKEMDNRDKARVLTVLNFYELVAAEYIAEFLDREVANRHLAYIAIATWEGARNFIEWRREEDPAYFQDLKHLYESFGASIIAVARDEQQA